MRGKWQGWEGKGKGKVEKEGASLRGKEEGWEGKRNVGNYGRDREGK